MVIRVSGYPGSGKTTLCRRLAEALGYEYHYAGGIFRAMAAEREQTIEEFFKALEEDPELERSIDTAAEALMNEKDNLVMEGRYAPFQPCRFPHINILLTVSPEESARRGLARPENTGRSLADIERDSAERVAVEKKRYQDLYHVPDHFDPAAFDFVLDTTKLTPDEVFDAVMKKVTA